MKFDLGELVDLVRMCSCQQVNIGQALFENLFLNGIQLLMKVENNMKKSQMSAADKILLRKRV
jgi:transposase, IS4 family